MFAITNRSLQIFVKVADCGKMSDAAKELSISQSSVSQAISEIEREFNIRLFERLGRRLYLSPLGQELLEYARRTLAYQSSLNEWLRRSAQSQRLRVGATVTVGATVLVSIIKELVERLPSVAPEVLIANTHLLEDKLLKSELDIALVEGRPSSDELICKNVIDDDLTFVCGRNHPFYGREAIDPELLNGQTFILREEGSGTRESTLALLKDKRIAYRTSWVSYSEEAIKKAALEGLGVTVLSRRLVERELNSGELWACRINGVLLSRSFGLLHHKDKFFTDAMRSFMEICKDYTIRKEET